MYIQPKTGNLCFILPKNEYLYVHLFSKLILDSSKRGYKITLLKSDECNWDTDQFINLIDDVIIYSSSLKHKSTSKIGIIRSELIYFRNESVKIKKAINRCSVEYVITPDTSDFCTNVLAQISRLKVFYIQHSNIISQRTFDTLKNRVYNQVHKLGLGINLSFHNFPPPFLNKKIHYLLWNKIWSNNLSDKTITISYVPKILKKSPKKIKLKWDTTSTVLVILNKRVFIGETIWNQYAEFYKKAFKGMEERVYFKVHPKDDFDFAQKIFNNYKVINQEFKANHDLVVGHWSSYLFDACLDGKPYILVNPHNQNNIKRFRLDRFPFVATRPCDVWELWSMMRQYPDKTIESYNLALNLLLGESYGMSSDKFFNAINE